MKIGVLIDQLSSLYHWQWMSHSNHEYIIYRDQNHQNSSQTNLPHHHTIMRQWLDYLIAQWVDHIICPPIIELYFHTQYPQILPIFHQYLVHILQYSIVGKIWFVGNTVQCESINLHRGEIKTTHIPIFKQLSNRYFNAKFPIWTSIDIHLPHRISDHKPDHPVCNQLIKSILRPLKNAAVDSIVWLDWAYYACDVSWSHHCHSIKRHPSDTVKTIFDSLDLSSSETYNVTICYTGTLRDLQQNKRLWWLLAKGQNHQIQQLKID